jgi:hypothetical protein
MSRNLNEAASKDTLAQWVSLSLKKALSESNIKKGFATIGIWPLNEHAVDTMLALSDSFQTANVNGEGRSGTAAGAALGMGPVHVHVNVGARLDAKGQGHMAGDEGGGEDQSSGFDQEDQVDPPEEQVEYHEGGEDSLDD